MDWVIFFRYASAFFLGMAVGGAMSVVIQLVFKWLMWKDIKRTK